LIKKRAAEKPPFLFVLVACAVALGGASLLAVIARLDRAIQYSRDADG
jgi:hypothetical protein